MKTIFFESGDHTAQSRPADSDDSRRPAFVLTSKSQRSCPVIQIYSRPRPICRPAITALAFTFTLAGPIVPTLPPGAIHPG